MSCRRIFPTGFGNPSLFPLEFFLAGTDLKVPFITAFSYIFTIFVTSYIADMDSIISFIKENFNFIMLLLGLIGVVIGIISVFSELKKKKEQKKDD